MKFPAPLQEAYFLSRPNRFTCLVQLPHKSAPVHAHLPDPGRLRELLQPGVRMWLEPKAGAQRKTSFQVWLVEKDRTLVSLNTQLPNLLVREALEQGSLPEFSQYTTWERERRVGNSRLDFFLETAGEACWVEVKSVTLVEDGRGLFPDAPTERGCRHIAELTKLHQSGARAVVFFVVQRDDAHGVAANSRTDPKFARALQNSHRNGVEFIAYRCEITTASATLSQRVPIVSELAYRA